MSEDDFSISDSNSRKKKFQLPGQSPRRGGDKKFSIPKSGPGVYQKGATNWRAVPPGDSPGGPSPIAASRSLVNEEEVGLGESIRYYFTVLARHKLAIFLVTLVCFTISVWQAWQKPNFYQTKAVLQKSDSRLDALKDPLFYNNYYYGTSGSNATTPLTVSKLIYTENLLKRAVEILDESREMIESGNQTVFVSDLVAPSNRENLREILMAVAESPRLRENLNLLESLNTDYLRSTVSAVANKDNDLLTITATNLSPEMSSLVANAVAQSILHYSQEIQRLSGRKATKYLSTILEKKKDQVEKKEEELVRRQKKKLSEGDHLAAISDKARYLLQRLEASQVALQEAELELESTHSQIDFLKGIVSKEPDKLITGVRYRENPLLNKVEEAKADLELALTRYTPEHPKVKRIQKDLSTLKELLDKSTLKREVDQTFEEINGLKHNYQKALAKEQSQGKGLLVKIKRLKNQVKSYNNQLLALPEKNLDIARLRQEIQISYKLIESITHQLEKARVMVMSQVGEFQVASFAPIPQFPAGPDRERNYILGIILGLFLGIGLAFLLDSLDNTFKDGQSIKKELQMKCLAELPLFPEKDKFLDPEDPKSFLGESFALLRNTVRYSAPNNPEKLLLVASALQGEGKSLLSLNLAMAYALEGCRTLLVELDVRKESDFGPDGSFPLEPKESGETWGISDYLSNEELSLDEVTFETSVENLYVIPRGKVESYSSRWFRSERFHEFLQKIPRDYEAVIVDTAAVLPVVDTTLIAPHARGVLFLVEAEKTPIPAVEKACERLSYVKSNLVGVVLNKVRHYSKQDFYYYYSY